MAFCYELYLKKSAAGESTYFKEMKNRCTSSRGTRAAPLARALPSRKVCDFLSGRSRKNGRRAGGDGGRRCKINESGFPLIYIDESYLNRRIYLN